MKKPLTILTAVLILGALSSCGKKNEKNPQENETEISTEAPQETLQTDPLAPKSTTTSDSGKPAVTTTSAVSETNTEITTVQPDPMSREGFSYDDNGAVIFEGDIGQQDDSVLISAAQALFDSACRTQWRFTVGCPYDIDINSYVENEFGWQFYEVTDSGIRSLADVENDYFKVFSDRYNNELSSLYIEQNGAVYALSGERGADYYYSHSRITSVEQKNDDELFFTVENYYTGSDFGSEPYSKTDEFSVVIDSDGVWRAGQFKLPY